MADKGLEVLEKYDFEVSQTARGRGVLVLYTDKGIKVVKAYSGSGKHILWTAGVLDAVNRSEVVAVDAYVPNTEGGYITAGADGTRYVVKEWYDTRDCDVKNYGDCLFAVRVLALLHNELNKNRPAELEYCARGLELDMEKHNNELLRVKKYLFRRNNRSDFELLAAGCCDGFYDEGIAAARKMKEFAAAGKGAKGLCHGSYNYHSICFGYRLPFGYYKQEGIIGGNYDQSNYDRLTLRANNIYTLFDDSKKRNWLNKFTLTTNLSYARIHSIGFGGGGGYYGGAITNALGMSPMLTPTLAPGSSEYQHQLDFYAGNDKYVPRYDAAGNLYTVPEAFGGGYQELTNPFYGWSFPAGKNWSHKFVTNIVGELQIWDGLKYRISFGGDLAFWGSNSHSEPSYYSNLNNTDAIHASAYSEMNRGWTWQLENLIFYDKEFGDHHLNVVLGESAKQGTGWWINASANKLYNFSKPWVTVAQGSPGEEDGGNRTGNAGPNSAWPKLLSYFGRVSYDFGSRYMVQATVRRDGSSRFGANHKWATFPSFSAGWNITNEPFLETRPQWWNNTKLRVSWGKNGNEAIGDFAYTVMTNGNNNYYFGPEGSSQTYGSKASGLANPDLKWEESTQTDIGLDLGFLDNSLQFTFDWYKKRTTGMLMTMMIPTYVGETKPIGNVGTMDNTGVEFDIRWARTFGEVEVNLGGNLSYVKNRLVDLGNSDGWRSEVSNGTAGDIARSMNGEVFPFFYGYKTAGIFQNQAEADAYNEKYGLTSGQTSWYAQPGDVVFVDTNGDGTINADDRTKIGKGLPDWTYGFNLGLGWKGFQLTAYFQGVWGNNIYDASLRGDTPAKNMPSWMLNRWTGEGTSNKIPIYRLGDSRNWQSSDIYIHDGAYLRCANLTLSYSLPYNIISKAGLSNVKVFVMGENLFTATKYYGFTPEVGDGVNIGIDYGNYPEARTFSVGFNVAF